MPAVAQANGALKPKADKAGARAGEGRAGAEEGATRRGEAVRSGEELPGREAKKARIDG